MEKVVFLLAFAASVVVADLQCDVGTKTVFSFESSTSIARLIQEPNSTFQYDSNPAYFGALPVLKMKGAAHLHCVCKAGDQMLIEFELASDTAVECLANSGTEYALLCEQAAFVTKLLSDRPVR